MGYFVADEPDVSEDTMAHNVAKVRALSDDDPDKLAYLNLACAWNTSDAVYRKYVGQLVSGGARVCSFDCYPFQIYNGVIGCLPFYFQTHRIVSEECQKTGIPFWAMPLCVEHARLAGCSGKAVSIDGFPEDYRIGLTKAKMRFMCNVPIIYGAKGLIWFEYSSECHAGNHCDSCGKDEGLGWYYRNALVDEHGKKTVLYDSVRCINDTISKIGPHLMGLQWLATVHGSDTNNIRAWVARYGTSGTKPELGHPEGGLQVITPATPIVASIDDSLKAPQNWALGIFCGKKDRYYYLIVLNKDIYHSRTITLTFKSPVKSVEEHLKKTSNYWSRISLPATVSKSCTLSKIRPGDIKLLRIAVGK